MNATTLRVLVASALVSISGPARAELATAYSNLTGETQKAFTTAANYNVEGPPFADTVRGALILDDVVVDSSFWGEYAGRVTVRFNKVLGPNVFPQAGVFIYDASGPGGGPGRRLYTSGGNTAFPATGESFFTWNGSPLFQVPLNGRMWIGFQFTSFGTGPSGIPALSVEEMASIGTRYYGPSEIGSTTDGIWVGDVSTMGSFSPPQVNPSGTFVAQSNLNLGLSLVVAVPQVQPRPSVSHANPAGPALQSGHFVGHDQFLGTRFTFETPLEISRIDLAITSANNQDWFVAVVPLDDATAFPLASSTTGLADLERVRGAQIFNPGSVSSFKVVSVPVSMKVGPGAHAVVVGTGMFGSPVGLTAFGGMQNYATMSGSDTIAWTGPSMSWNGGQFDIIANATPTYGISIYGEPFVDVPVIETPPEGAGVIAGQSGLLSVEVSAFSPVSYQWRFNGQNITGATSASLTIPDFQFADAGAYDVVATTASGSTTSQAAVLGVLTTDKASGDGSEIGPNIQHANGNVYDQVLLTGSSVTVTADPGEVTRVSFVDLSDDIVQAEFSGAGAMTLALSSPTGPAGPVKYNQGVNYMKGHATIVISGADETTNLSVFSVGRANAVDASLFRPVYYDGVADLALITIQSSDGKFGGLRAGNGSFYGRTGMTGIVAPGIQFTGPVVIGYLSAFDSATPALLLGGADDVMVAGGDLFQRNGRAVQVSGITQLRFVAGTNSHGVFRVARNNRARLEEDGADVTDEIVINPVP